MSFFIQIREKITFLKKLLKNNSDNFQDQKIVWKYLDQTNLSIEEEKILKSSFRTRIKSGENNLIFQFRISPTSLSESERENMKNISQQVNEKLKKLIPHKNIETQIKVSDCCGKNCYSCTTYPKI